MDVIRFMNNGIGNRPIRKNHTFLPLVSVSKLLESAESFGFKGGGLIRPGAVDVDA
jgi:hypothetical protein